MDSVNEIWKRSKHLVILNIQNDNKKKRHLEAKTKKNLINFERARMRSR